MQTPKLAKPPIWDTESLLAFHAATFGDAKMTGPDGQPVPTPPAPTPPAPPAPQPTDPPEKTLTQSEVNRIAAREKDEGRNAALKEVQDALGVDLETAKQILKTHNEQTEAQKSEAQKAREAADREKAEAESAKAAAAREVHDARVDRAFVAAGLVDEAKILRYSKMLDVEVGAKAEDIKKAVEKLKEEEPALFGASTNPPPRPPAPGSDPKGGPPKPKTDQSAYDRGLERAKQLNTGTPSYASLIEGNT